MPWPPGVSEGAVSEGAVSEGAVSEGAVSEGAVSEGAVSGGAVSEGAVSPYCNVVELVKCTGNVHVVSELTRVEAFCLSTRCSRCTMARRAA